MNKRWSRLLIVALMVFLATQYSHAETFRWVYVDGTYSCRVGEGAARKSYKVVTFSQVYAICESETNSVAIAEAQQRNSDQAAENKCRGGNLSFLGFLEGYISDTQAATDQHRAQHIRNVISSDNTTLTETFFVSAPYSRKCR